MSSQNKLRKFCKIYKLAHKNNVPSIIKNSPANASMPYSTGTACLLFFEIAVSETTFPEMAINTTIDIVNAIPIEMVTPKYYTKGNQIHKDMRV